RAVPPVRHPAGTGGFSLHRALGEHGRWGQRLPPCRQDHLPAGPAAAHEACRMSTRVLVVDDSALIREVLSRMLEQEPDLTVVGVAADPIEAREKIKALDPDGVTLDIEMPNMNGLAFLDRLMRLRPTPVVMVST